MQRFFAFRPMRLTARIDTPVHAGVRHYQAPHAPRASETRMDIGVIPARDGPQRVVTLMLTRVRFL